MNLDKQLQLAAEWIHNAERLIITAGAGMGVDSGMPDFRGTNGFWKAYPALGKAQIQFQTIANPSSFLENPKLAWGFYGHRLKLYRQLTPHKGFDYIQSWVAPKPAGSFVFTSNVDGHFQKAGFNEDSIYECHGSIHYFQCINNCQNRLWSANDFNPEINPETGMLTSELPICPDCRSLARPAILMFGDWGFNNLRSDQQADRLDQWLLSNEKTIVLEIGAGTNIPSVRHFGEQLCKNPNNKLIRINPAEPNINEKTGLGIPLKGLEALEKINNILLTSYNGYPCHPSHNNP